MIRTFSGAYYYPPMLAQIDSTSNNMAMIAASCSSIIKWGKIACVSTGEREKREAQTCYSQHVPDPVCYWNALWKPEELPTRRPLHQIRFAADVIGTNRLITNLHPHRVAFNADAPSLRIYCVGF